MLTCNGCRYRKGNKCLHYRVSDMDSSRRCRYYQDRSRKPVARPSLAEAFRRYKRVPPRPDM